MSLALKKEYLPHYTYDEYCQWEGNWELIDGVPNAMSPQPTGKHQRIAGKLLIQFDEKLKQCSRCEVSLPVDWKISETLVIQPDLFVACFDFRNVKFISQTPVIVVEARAPSTREKDLHVKRNIYFKQGVKYYVIIDPENDSYKILQLAGTDYSEAQTGYDGTFTFSLDNDCQVKIDFAKIWT